MDNSRSYLEGGDVIRNAKKDIARIEFYITFEEKRKIRDANG